jgi:hypothetical protein
MKVERQAHGFIRGLMTYLEERMAQGGDVCAADGNDIARRATMNIGHLRLSESALVPLDLVEHFAWEYHGAVFHPSGNIFYPPRR